MKKLINNKIDKDEVFGSTIGEIQEANIVSGSFTINDSSPQKYGKRKKTSASNPDGAKLSLAGGGRGEETSGAPSSLENAKVLAAEICKAQKIAKALQKYLGKFKQIEESKSFDKIFYKITRTPKEEALVKVVIDALGPNGAEKAAQEQVPVAKVIDNVKEALNKLADEISKKMGLASIREITKEREKKDIDGAKRAEKGRGNMDYTKGFSVLGSIQKSLEEMLIRGKKENKPLDNSKENDKQMGVDPKGKNAQNVPLTARPIKDKYRGL